MVTAISQKQTFFDSQKGGIPSFVKSIKNIVNRIALGIIFNIALSFLLFYLQPNLFCLGFAAGFIFDQKTESIVKKVNIVFNAKRSLLERLFLFTAGGILAFLTIPTTMTIANLYHSAQWGAKLYRKSLSQSHS